MPGLSRRPARLTTPAAPPGGGWVRRTWDPRIVALVVLVAAIAVERSAQGAEDEPLDPDTLARYQRLSRPTGAFGQVFGTLSFGRGIRLNNPYRLQSQLGDSAESLSLTAPYLDVGLGLAFGEAEGLLHGGMFHVCFALEGVAQQAMSASYLLGYRASSPLLVYGRLGPSILITPDSNVGGELAVGLAAMLTGVWGVTAEILGNLYYGAGTYEAEYTAVPIVSGQLGLIADFEVLP